MSAGSIRFTDDIEAAVGYVSRREKAEIPQSLRMLTRPGFETYVAKAYRLGEVTLRESARLLRRTLWETLDLMADAGVTGNVSATEVLERLTFLRP